MSMLSSSLEGLACQRHIDIDRRLLAGTDRAMRVCAELFLARKRLLELVADRTHAERP
jgi:hypothetical protein